MPKHFTIPVFIPERACPFRCIYCNQYRISNTVKQPDEYDIVSVIEKYLQTFPSDSIIEIGFFGGSFTGMPIEEQNRYLQIVQPYLKQGQVSSVRLSTRPDYIDQSILDNLKLFGVKTIELGGQSLHDDILHFANRGHTLKDIEKAAGLIRKNNFELGIQMMIGLPSDTMDKAIFTARKIIELGASNTRIYPALVIKDTVLADLYNSKQYQPLSLEEAVLWTKEIIKLFEAAKINILRVGLHPTEGLMQGEDLLAGPFHVSFKELVMTEIWNDILTEKLHSKTGDMITIRVHPKQLNAAIGYFGKNKKMLEQQFKKVRFTGNDALQVFENEIVIE